MVFLIGVNHIIQHTGFSFHQKEAAISEFLEHVEMKALELKVKTIAEEWSQEANKNNNVPFSTVQTVATKLDLKHIFCDPTNQERKKHGIEKSNTDGREEFWIERLKEVLQDNILFVCGEDHLESFKSKLNSCGILVEIVSRGWGMGLYGG